MKKEMAAGLITLGLTACGGGLAVNENLVLYSDPVTASDPAIQAHEKCHQEQMKAMGGSDKFWDKYIHDDAFACEAEVACGVDPDKHFACR